MNKVHIVFRKERVQVVWNKNLWSLQRVDKGIKCWVWFIWANYLLKALNFFFSFKYYKTWTSKPDLRSRVEHYFYCYYYKKSFTEILSNTVTCTWCIVLFRLVVLEETMLLSFPKVWFFQVWISLIPIQQNIWRQCLVKTLTPVQLLTCLKDLFGWVLCPSQG